jgi:hypothetical protein
VRSRASRLPTIAIRGMPRARLDDLARQRARAVVERHPQPGRYFSQGEAAGSATGSITWSASSCAAVASVSSWVAPPGSSNQGAAVPVQAISGWSSL